jgi:hypothetical protein
MPKKENFPDYPHLNCASGFGCASHHCLPPASNMMSVPAQVPMMPQHFGYMPQQIACAPVGSFPAQTPVNSAQMLGPAWNGQMPGGYTTMSSVPGVQVPVGGLGLSGPAVMVGANGAIGGMGGMGPGSAPVVSPPGGWYWPGPQRPKQPPADGGAVWNPSLPMPLDRYYAQGGQTRPTWT